jgi:hypothetical protein
VAPEDRFPTATAAVAALAVSLELEAPGSASIPRFVPAACAGPKAGSSGLGPTSAKSPAPVAAQPSLWIGKPKGVRLAAAAAATLGLALCAYGVRGLVGAEDDASTGDPMSTLVPAAAHVLPATEPPEASIVAAPPPAVSSQAAAPLEEPKPAFAGRVVVPSIPPDAASAPVSQAVTTPDAGRAPKWWGPWKPRPDAGSSSLPPAAVPSILGAPVASAGPLPPATPPADPSPAAAPSESAAPSGSVAPSASAAPSPPAAWAPPDI